MSVAAHEDTAAEGRVAAAFAQRREELEELTLTPQAARSYPARRAREEPDCSLRTPFQRDRDRIVHCKAFRRLKHKTQVFVAPQGDHYRTRLTHTLEVTGISRTVARALGLNEDLTEAIGLGHDLGHPPFGHIGEEVLDACLRERFGGGFRHYEHSLRVIDRVAYINHDIDDAVRAGLLAERDLPAEPIAVLGRTGSERIDALVHDMVERSARAGEIVQGEQAARAMGALREFMFERVYLGPQVRAERERIEAVLRRLFEHYVRYPEQISGYPSMPDATADDLAQRVTDYLAGMTDRYCIRVYTELQVPRAFAGQ
jgi:dGTPase